jgi:hypothetical protein
VKASSRSKQLQRYKSNWATIEIMKTLIKNRRTYKNRIGSLDDEQAVKNEEVDDLDGINHDSDLDSMYAEEKKVLGGDEDDNGEDGDEGRNDLDMYGGSNGGNDEDGNGANTNNEEGWGDGEDGNGANINNEEGGHDEDGNSAKIDGNEVGNDGINAKIKGGRSLPGGKDNGGSTKRKLEVTQDDEGSAGTKKTKKVGSGGHQGATQSTKKGMPKRNSGKK